MSSESGLAKTNVSLVLKVVLCLQQVSPQTLAIEKKLGHNHPVLTFSSGEEVIDCNN